MKLRRASFKNFRVLRDLEIDFAISDERKLTVIRAENASGKTTMLIALQWAFVKGVDKTYQWGGAKVYHQRGHWPA